MRLAVGHHQRVARHQRGDTPGEITLMVRKMGGITLMVRKQGGISLMVRKLPLPACCVVFGGVRPGFSHARL